LLHLKSDSVEYSIHIFQVIRIIKTIVNLILCQLRIDSLVSFNQCLKMRSSLPCLHRFWLNQIISFLTAHALINKYEQDALGKNNAMSFINVLFHVFRKQGQFADDT